jgi:3-hydroxyacyl-[acyl-carrier-protein] dehydratase
MLSFDQLQPYLPQRFPMLMVDRVLDYEVGKSLRALKAVSGNDIHFLGHFPAFSILPGAMLMEGMGQCTAILFQLTYGALSPDEMPMFGAFKGRFLKPVFPGDLIVYEVEAVKMVSFGGVFKVTASVDGEPVARCELSMGKAKVSALRRG